MFNGNLFDAAIRAKGETLMDAAKVMGMNSATLSRKKNGTSDFYRKEIDAFCRHYNVNPDKIFFASDSA